MTDCVLSEYVVTDFAYKADIASKTFGGDSLIGSLSARSHHEIISKDSLSGGWHFAAERRHVGVGATDN